MEREQEMSYDIALYARRFPEDIRGLRTLTETYILRFANEQLEKVLGFGEEPVDEPIRR